MSASAKHARDEEVEEQVERKKRRIVTPVKSSDKTSAAADKDSKMTPRALFNMEENEVLERDATEDVETHREVVAELQTLMGKIKSIKRSNLSEDKKRDIIKRLQGDAILQFVSLKRLNRIGHLRCKKIREITQEVKQKVDQKQLSLQNLLYELMHLQREISKCVQFKSMDEEINLVTEEEFLRVVPREISDKLEKEKDEHKMMVARLDWELRERKALAAKYASSLKSKEDVQREIQKLKTSLECLNPMLATVLESTKPIQEHLEMPFEENDRRQKTARHLPPPLYFLFVQASSFGKAFDNGIAVEVVGDVELVHSMEKVDSPMDEESDSEDESEQTNKIHRRSTTDSRLTKRQEQLLKRHPLGVSIGVSWGGPDGGRVILSFQYMISLDFVVVSCSLEPNGAGRDDGPRHPGDPFDPLRFLDRLYDDGDDDDDDGEEMPNPENVFKLAKLGIADLGSHLKDAGKPYRWVQRLCGLQNPVRQRPSDPGAQNGGGGRGGRMSNIEELIRLVRNRFKDRRELRRQLDVLEGTNEKPTVNWMPTFDFPNVPRKISSQLVLWRSSNYDEFVASPITANVRTCDLVGVRDFFFFGVLERNSVGSPPSGSAQLDAGEGSAMALGSGKASMGFFVVIGPDYPSSLPLFCVRVDCGGIERSSLNDEHLRELEGSVNLRSAGDLDPRNVLLNQVALLSSCFDVYLETGGLGRTVAAVGCFDGDKSFLRRTRGPTRSKPYRYINKLGFFAHF